MSVAYLFNVFIIASFAGWIYECIYCTIKTTRWQNRGFLFGPICPIYGTGLVGAKLIFQYLIPWIRWKGEGAPAQALPGYTLSYPDNLKQILLIFLVAALGSAVLEYGTSWVLEKIFHARWWDYSNTPLNVNGRICLPATCGFGLAGIVIVGYILPFLNAGFDLRLPTGPEELLSLLFMFMLSADLVLSVSAATRLLERIESMESVFDERVGATYEPIGRVQRAAARKIVTVTESAADMLGSMKDGAVDRLESMKDGAADMLGNMKDGAADRLESVKGSAGSMIGNVTSSASGIVRKTSGLTREKIDWLLSVMQRNTFMNIKKYSSEKHEGTAARMRAMLTGRRKKRSEEP